MRQRDTTLINLVGIPYSQMNCWDLTREFLRRKFNVSLFHYFGDTPQDRNITKNLIYSSVGDFDKVEGEWQYGDILTLRLYGIESHIAVYIGGGRMLHTSRKTGSVIEPIEKWKKLICGAYRIKGLKHD